MTRINYGRVLLGALVAGVVANACDAVTNMFIMANDMQMMLQRLGRNVDAMNETVTIVTWIVIDFIYAAIIVFTYAAIRPRFGPGPNTAVLAGLIVFLSVTVVLFGFYTMGLFTPAMFWKSSALSLVTTVLASLAGGAVYREE